MTYDWSTISQHRLVSELSILFYARSKSVTVTLPQLDCCVLLVFFMTYFQDLNKYMINTHFYGDFAALVFTSYQS